MSRDDILSWSVLRILDAYGSGELSPPEYLEACLERIEETRSTVNAVGDVYADEARAGAEEAAKRWHAAARVRSKVFPSR